MPLRELDTVRVVGLREPAAQHLTITRAQRPPRLGDMGTVIQIASSDARPPRYVVESITGEGETIWIAEFAENELQLEAEFERGRPLAPAAA